MTRLPHLGSLSAGLLFLGCSQQPAPTTDADLQAVRQVLQAEIDAANAGDLPGFKAILSPDAVVMPPNEPAHQGADLDQWLKTFFEQFSIKVNEKHDELVVSGEWAINRYSFEWTVTPKAGGSGTTEAGVGIHLLHRQGDGSWKLARDIWHPTSPPPVPAPATKP
jgi:ketosteroid isomerase-like protein